MLNEFRFIDRWLRPFPTKDESVIVPPGDDAAAMLPSPGAALVATTDAMVDGVHFRSSLWPAAAVGRKALAVNLSDLASMGARPRYALLALCLPKGVDQGWLDRVARGMAGACEEHGVLLVGGNVSSASELSFTVTLLGEAAPDRLLTRSGAQPGDLVYVSGTVGDSALGLESMLRRHRPPSRLTALERRHCLPTARVDLGLRLASLRAATAAVDISDGLAADLSHLLSAGSVGAEISLERLPLSRAYRRAVGSSRDPLRAALTGGEDYELLFTSPPDAAKTVVRVSRAAGVPVTRIGRITSATGARFFEPGGECYDAGQGGWRHE